MTTSNLTRMMTVNNILSKKSIISSLCVLGLIHGTFLHSVLEMAETDSDLMNLRYWVPLSSTAMGAGETSEGFEARDQHWSPTLPASYKPVYSPPSARTFSMTRPGHHHNRPLNTSLHLNVQKFLEQELSRSQEVRRRLRNKSEDI